jgi:hypothetical protein
MKKTWVLHPFLFALFPVLFVYSQNMEHMSLPQIWPATLLFLGGTLLALLPLALILRNTMRAGAILSLALVLFFSYGQVYGLLWGGQAAESAANSAANRPLILLIAWGLIFAGGAALILRTRRGWRDVTKILNVVALVLVASSLLNIGLYEVRSRAADRRADSARRLEITAAGPLPAEALPDIYYIILDGYARADVLQEVYGYDNTPFIDFLAQRGFYVADRSQANYAHTALSLASSLNLDYLDDEAARIGLDTQDRQPLAALIDDSAALRFLKQQGYTIVAFPTGYDPTDLTGADIYLGSGRPLNDVEIGLLLTTPIPWLVMGDSQFNPYAPHANRIRYTLDHLAETAQLPVPHFVFAHVLGPHPPFVFDAQGNEVAPERGFNMGEGNHFLERGGTRQEYLAGYTGQLTYINSRVEVVLDELLAQSSRPAIVILQSDHGPGSRLDWDDPQNTYFKERMSILNAYLLPGGETAGLYDEITPVNTFRLIFNHYFGTDLELLEDRSYFSTWEQPYRFIDVTDEARAE